MASLPAFTSGVHGQIFALTPGKSKLTTGADPVLLVTAVWCHEDGSIDVTYPGVAEPETLAFVAGDQFGFVQPVTVDITDGVWSFM